MEPPGISSTPYTENQTVIMACRYHKKRSRFWYIQYLDSERKKHDKPAGLKANVQNTCALCTTTTPARFISSMAFLTSSGPRLTPRAASSIKCVLKPISAASSAVNFTQ